MWVGTILHQPLIISKLFILEIKISNSLNYYSPCSLNLNGNLILVLFVLSSCQLTRYFKDNLFTIKVACYSIRFVHFPLLGENKNKTQNIETRDTNTMHCAVSLGTSFMILTPFIWTQIYTLCNT